MTRVGHFVGDLAYDGLAHYLTAYRAGMAALPDDRRRHGRLRAAVAAPQAHHRRPVESVNVPVLALLAGRSVMHKAPRAAARARKCLAHGQVEVWEGATHALNGEFPERIAERTQRFWDES